MAGSLPDLPKNFLPDMVRGKTPRFQYGAYRLLPFPPAREWRDSIKIK
ncbi:hypothetical protein HMPREF1051_1299 [Neisseria sicca VK64]|uniref:Uncharacterized protein n=1 Tax=Neisseria sicca VK64 TaxID=1095748 RepID=I2NX69_NEISI|nr:hypothetical protein HMPREF1051_1299 [Neisseria sicca VK64]